MVTCAVPATISHGSLNEVNPVAYGVEVTVICDAGYEHIYDVRCLATGHWNDSLGCTGKYMTVAKS